jgi:hypothetical protein
MILILIKNIKINYTYVLVYNKMNDYTRTRNGKSWYIIEHLHMKLALEKYLTNLSKSTSNNKIVNL